MDGLKEVLAPGSSVEKISQTTSVIRKRTRKEVHVRYLDLAKFGTRNEKETEHGQCFDGRPRKVKEKTLEQKIINHKRDLLRKDLGSKNIKRNRKQSEDVSVIFLGHSSISTFRNVARALKIRIRKLNPKHDDAFQNRPDLTQLLHFRPPFSIVAPTTQPNTAGPSALQSIPSTQQLTPILLKEKRKIQVSGTSIGLRYFFGQKE